MCFTTFVYIKVPLQHYNDLETLKEDIARLKEKEEGGGGGGGKVNKTICFVLSGYPTFQ